MNIVVLAGGISTERDVSLISGKMIYQALMAKGHHAILLDVYLGLSGECDSHIFEQEKDWAASVSNIGIYNPDIEKVKALRPDGDRNFFGPNVISLCQMADVVFMALHGENGENGKIQACFDLMGITYTGTDYLSSAISMNKALSKDLFRQYGIPTPQGFSIQKGRKNPMPEKFPCIVKTNSGGSSVGVTIAQNPEEYEKACEIAFLYDTTAVVETYIKGREFSIGVMDGKALPIIEIAPKQGFYDYKNKYQAGSTVETCPAILSAQVTEAMQKSAEHAFAALGLHNYARFDFMMNEKEEFFCLEANTLPGMTPTSLLPQEAAAVGKDFGTLCEEIIEISLRDKR